MVPATLKSTMADALKVKQLRRELVEDEGTLRLIMSRKGDGRVLLVIDQLEELFTEAGLGGSGDEGGRHGRRVLPQHRLELRVNLDRGAARPHLHVQRVALDLAGPRANDARLQPILGVWLLRHGLHPHRRLVVHVVQDGNGGVRGSCCARDLFLVKPLHRLHKGVPAG